jgi:hypothetical protein
MGGLLLFYLDARAILQIRTPLDGQFQDLAGRVRNLNDLRHGGNIYRQFGAEAFTYPPGAITFFWPLQFVSATARNIAWTMLSLTALCGTYLVTLRKVTTLSWTGLTIIASVGAVVTSWVCTPVLSGLQWGQTALMLQFVVVLDMVVIRGPRRGILTGLAVAIKLFPALFLVVLALQRDWRALRRALLTAFAATGIAAVLWPTSTWFFFRHVLFSGQELSHFNTLSNLVNDTSVAALFNRPPFFNGTEPHAVRYAICAALALGGIALAQRAWRSGYPVTAVVVVLAVDGMALPNVWIHYYSFVPLLGVACLEWSSSRSRTLRMALTAALSFPYVYFRTISGTGPIHTVLFEVICDADALLALASLVVLGFQLFVDTPLRPRLSALEQGDSPVRSSSPAVAIAERP